VIQVRDSVSGELTLTIRDGGTAGCYQLERGNLDGPRFHIAASADGQRLLIVGQMQIFDLSTGELVSDLHQAVFDGLRGADLRPDDRFAGHGGGGTVPLDGAFSPDGQLIVFDGAVIGPDGPAVTLFSIAIDGSGFDVIGEPYDIDPAVTNDHNFSFLNPFWR